jgi:hypothetical protein
MSQVKRFFISFYPPAGNELCAQIGSYLLRSGRHHCSLRRTQLRLRPLTVFRNSRLQPFLDQAKNPAIGHAVLDKLEGPFVRHVVEGTYDTLPIITTSPRESPLSVPAIRSKANRSLFLGRSIGMADCISF